MAPPDVAAACGAPQLGQNATPSPTIVPHFVQCGMKPPSGQLQPHWSRSLAKAESQAQRRNPPGKLRARKAYRVQFITEFAVAVIPYSDFSCEYRICSRMFGYE